MTDATEKLLRLMKNVQVVEHINEDGVVDEVIYKDDYDKVLLLLDALTRATPSPAEPVAYVDVGPHDHGPFKLQMTLHGIDTLSDGRHDLYTHPPAQRDDAVVVPEGSIPINRACKAYLVIGVGWDCECKFKHPILCADAAHATRASQGEKP